MGIKQLNLWFRNNNFLIIIVGIYLLLTIPFLSSIPLVWNDEGFFSEGAWNFANKGVVAQPLWAGLFGFENLSMHLNYLYFVTLSFSFSLFGLGIFQARIFSVVCGLLLLFVVYLFIGRLYSKKIAQLAIVLLAFNPLFLLSARLVRPEMLMTLFGFIAFGLVVLGLRRERDQRWMLFIGGIFATLAAIVHINGIVLSLALLVLFLMQKKSKGGVSYFLLGTSLAALPYIIFILAHFDVFLSQNLAISGYRIPTFPESMIINLINEPSRWMFGVTTKVSIFLGVISFFLLLPNIKKLQEIYIFLIVIILYFTFIEHNKYYGYLLIILPFLCILSSILLVTLMRKIKPAVVFFLILLLIISLGVVEFKIMRDHAANYDAYCSQIKEYLDEKEVIFADNLFFYCFPEGNLKSITNVIRLHEVTGKSFNDIFEEQDVAYLIIDPAMQYFFETGNILYDIPEEYVSRMQECQLIGEIEDAYYTVAPTKDHTTKIYKC